MRNLVTRNNFNVVAISFEKCDRIMPAQKIIPADKHVSIKAITTPVISVDRNIIDNTRIIKHKYNIPAGSAFAYERLLSYASEASVYNNKINNKTITLSLIDTGASEASPYISEIIKQNKIKQNKINKNKNTREEFSGKSNSSTSYYTQ